MLTILWPAGLLLVGSKATVKGHLGHNDPKHVIQGNREALLLAQREGRSA